MHDRPKRFEAALTLVGGGPFDRASLAEAQALAPVLVAADQAADRLADMGETPALVVGDMDSIADLEAWRRRRVPVLHLPEQDTTDFEKCLYATDAPFYLAVGFTGGRIDHSLAVLHAMLRRPEKRVLLIGDREIAFFVPPDRSIGFRVAQGSTVSLFPLAETTGTLSEGLRWSVRGLTLAPGHQIGTSNQALAGDIAVAFDRPGALMTLDRRALTSAIATLTGAVSSGAR
ncbi:MAG: thiamine diphosphokinase [Pseudomonadota bacterium]